MIKLLSTCLAISMLALSTGCRSGSFTKPDLGKLAFWKSENLRFASKDKVAPPPPARHFDPTPISGDAAGGDRKSEIVNLDNRNLQRRFKNDIEEMKAELEAANKALGTSIGKSSSAGVVDSATEFVANAKSGLESASDSVQSGLDGLGGQIQSEMSAAQNDFQAAMNNTSESLGNDFEAAKESAKNTALDWKNNIDNSFEAASASLEKTRNNLNNSLESSADNSFKSGIHEFGGSLAPLKNEAVQTKPKLESVQDQMAEAKRQIEALKKQVAIAGQKSGSTPSDQSFASGNSFDAQPADSFAGAPSNSNSSFASSFQPGPAIKVAQRPGSTDSAHSGAISDPTPTNRLRSDLSDQSSLTSSFSPQAYPSTSHGGFTPRNNDFSGNFSPVPTESSKNDVTLPATPVDFQNGSDQSMVMAANYASSQNAGDSAATIQNHVSEIDIPESVLKGTGSYAPGSIQPLQGNQ